MHIDLQEYYNKFNEDKRLQSRRGQVEFITTMKYIHQCLDQFENPKVIEVGAGTGAYSVALANEGYDVTAVELVKSNLGRLKAKKSSVKAYQGNALDLSRFEDNSFDVTLVLGPLYHLDSYQQQLTALKEAKRITKDHGYILVAYIMNEYCIIQYGFMDGHILETAGQVDDTYHILPTSDYLYRTVRLEDIYRLSDDASLKRIKTIAADGPAHYLNSYLKAMDEASFKAFMDYHLKTCERLELLGASAHTVDILQK